MKKLLPSTLAVLLLAVFATGVPRQLILYESETNNEIFHNLTSATPDTRAFPWMKNVTRICHRGSWYCYLEPDYKDPVKPNDNDQNRMVEGDRIFLQQSDLTFTCRNLSSLPGFNRQEFQKWGFGGLCGSVRPAGGGLDLSMDTLTVFTGKHMDEEELTISQDQIARFPENFTVRSFASTRKNSCWTPLTPSVPLDGGEMDCSPYKRGGGSNWTLFEEADYGGLPECLVPPEALIFDQPFPERLSYLRVKSIGSIKRGCDPADVSLWRLDRNTWPKVKAIAQDFWDTIWGNVRIGVWMRTTG